MLNIPSKLAYLTKLRPLFTTMFTPTTITMSTPINYRFGGGHSDHQPIEREKITLRDERSGYYINPNDAARRTMRIIAQYEKVNDPENMTLSTQWHQLGLNQLDTVQLLIGIQQQFRIEFPDDVCQKFKDINDVVEYVSRSFYSQ